MLSYMIPFKQSNHGYPLSLWHLYMGLNCPLVGLEQPCSIGHFLQACWRPGV